MIDSCPRHTLAVALLTAMLPGVASAQIRYEDSNGTHWQVRQQTVQQVVPVTENREQQQTIYRQQVVTENYQQQQAYSVPVTQYQLVSELRGRWNPFVTPYWTHRYEPVTTWQQQVATVQIPVTRVASAAETRTVQTPVTTYRTVQSTVDVRTAMGPSASGKRNRDRLDGAPLTSADATPSATIAALPSGSFSGSSTTVPAVADRAIGGQAMESDPPKQSTGWSRY